MTTRLKGLLILSPGGAHRILFAEHVDDRQPSREHCGAACPRARWISMVLLGWLQKQWSVQGRTALAR